MPNMRYKGRADSRSIDANAWKKAGVEDQNKVTWDKGNNFTAEVNDQAAKYLKDTYPYTFEEVEEKDSGSGITRSNTPPGSNDD